jgi:ribulose kinase
MSKTNEDVNTKNAEKRFWEAYRACMEANRVREEVEEFLSHLGSKLQIAEWQVKKARNALQLLYEVFLPRIRGSQDRDSKKVHPGGL